MSDVPLKDGERIGRYLIIRDIDGRRHAIGAGAIQAVTEVDSGAMLVMPGGKLLEVPWSMETVLAWLDGRP